MSNKERANLYAGVTLFLVCGLAMGILYFPEVALFFLGFVIGAVLLVLSRKFWLYYFNKKDESKEDVPLRISHWVESLKAQTNSIPIHCPTCGSIDPSNDRIMGPNGRPIRRCMNSWHTSTVVTYKT